jgi:choline dehydrogenase
MSEQSKHYDFIVVGGGSAGCAAAAKLIAAGYRVALIEAGPDYGAHDDGRWPAEILNAGALANSHDWDYKAGRWVFQRARVMGGCSSHNGCIAAIGHRRDYDDWRLPGWSTAELEPYFANVVESMRVRTYTEDEAGPFHAKCLEAARALGWREGCDLCDLDANDGFGLEAVNIVGNTRWNSAFAYLDAVRSSSRLTIVDRALVDRFIETDTAIGLHLLRAGKAEVIHGDHLVLSAGVYGTAEILQRSGVGDPEHLRALDIAVQTESINVGNNLHDHPMVHADRAVGPQLQQWLDEATRAGFVPEEQTLGKAISSVAEDGLFDLHLFPVCANTQTSLLHGRVNVEVACVTPKSRGTLRITSADPAAMSAIDHNYLGDEAGHDLAVMLDGVALANELLDQPALGKLLGESLTDTSTEAGIRAHVEHYYHPVGTCAMGLTDEHVCDARGQVRGLRRVSIADASLMPQIPRANTNLPSVMIGERIAAFLIDA